MVSATTLFANALLGGYTEEAISDLTRHATAQAYETIERTLSILNNPNLEILGMVLAAHRLNEATRKAVEATAGTDAAEALYASLNP